MNWRHRMVIVMLVVLAALPLAGMMCAMTCVSGLSGSSAAAAHHKGAQDCGSKTSETGAKIGALSEYHCRTHDGAVPHAAATAAQRADALAVNSAAITSDPVHPLFGSINSFDMLFRYTPPQGTAPPTVTPLVLRI